MNHAAFQCPKCGSDETQRLAVLRDKSTTRTRILGIGGNTDWTFALGGGTVTQQSELARRLAPPKKPGLSDGGFGLKVVILFLGTFCIASLSLSGLFHRPFRLPYFLVGLAGIGLAAFMGRAAWRYSREHRPMAEQRQREAKATYENKLARWQRSFFCNRCGHIFEKTDA
jgi:hypothetical protein